MNTLSSRSPLILCPLAGLVRGLGSQLKRLLSLHLFHSFITLSTNTEYRLMRLLHSVVCARLFSPSRWYPLVDTDMFGQLPTWLSIIFNDTVIFLAALPYSSLPYAGTTN
jgi:hypothetical protein